MKRFIVLISLTCALLTGCKTQPAQVAHIPSGDKIVLKKLAAAAEEDKTREALEDGWYRVLNKKGKEIASIETALLEGTHKDICVITEDRVLARLNEVLEQ